VVELLEEVAGLRRTVAAQRNEIVRLKGDPPRPADMPVLITGGIGVTPIMS
jgi:ferredoxin-NADP reductase